MTNLFSKKKILIILLVLALIAVAFIFTMVNISKDGQNTPSITQFIKPPNIQNHFDNSYKINVKLTGDEIDIPKELPYLKQKRLSPIKQTEANSIATSFGLSTEPLEFTDAKFGKFYVWNSNEYSLIVYTDQRKIKLGPAYDPAINITSTPDKKLTEEEYLNISKDYLTEKLNLDPNKLIYNNTTHLKLSESAEILEGANDESSQLTQVNFSYTNFPQPVYLLNGRDGQIYLNFTRDGKLLNLEALLYAAYDPSENKYSIRQFEEIKNTINESVVISMGSTSVNLPDLRSDIIDEVTINEIKLGYLVDSLDSEMIQPFFILDGIANLNGSLLDESITLALPAFAKQLDNQQNQPQ